MAHPLDGVRAKIGRAQNHFDHIDTIVKSFLSPEDYTQEIAGHEFKDDWKQLIVRAKTPRPINPAFPLVIGDCIHNLRSALDHLVFQFAVLNGTSHGAESKTSFPICLNAGSFKNAIRHKVAPFIARTALAAIEEVQPYKTLDPATNAPLGDQAILWVLSQLDVLDKHRVILFAMPQVSAEGFTITGPSGEIYDTSVAPKWKPMEDGAEIIRFDLSTAFQRPGKVNMNIKLAANIHFAETGLICDGRGVQSTLDDCTRVVRTIVDDFGRRFFGE